MCFVYSVAESRCSSFLLAPAPPRLHARKQNQPGHDQDGQIEDAPLLVRRQRDAPIFGVLGADRDQVLLLREPVDGVQEEIAVALDAERAVAGEVRVAERDDARLRWLLRVLRLLR